MEHTETKYLHYKKYGAGPRHLLAFHGFGQDHTAFSHFQASLGSQFTILSFDLLFHGDSRWPHKELPVSERGWQELLTRVLQSENIQRFSLMGYSLGGKVALATAALFAGQVDEIILAAPDGVYHNPWYRLATGTRVMRSVFRYLTHRPAWLAAVISSATSMKLISKNLGKFAASQIANPTNSVRIYNSWVGYRQFSRQEWEAVQIINNNGIKLTMVAGRHDSVIPWQNLWSLTEKCAKHEWVLIKTGHQSLLRKYHEQLVKETAAPATGVP